MEDKVKFLRDFKNSFICGLVYPEEDGRYKWEDSKGFYSYITVKDEYCNEVIVEFLSGKGWTYKISHYKNFQLHNEKGPAVEWTDKRNHEVFPKYEYWIEGKNITKKEMDKRLEK